MTFLVQNLHHEVRKFRSTSASWPPRVYGCKSNSNGNSKCFSIFSTKELSALNLFKWNVVTKGSFSSLSCFSTHTSSLQFSHLNFVSGSPILSTLVKDSRALERESTFSISKLKSTKGSWVSEQWPQLQQQS